MTPFTAGAQAALEKFAASALRSRISFAPRKGGGANMLFNGREIGHLGLRGIPGDTAPQVSTSFIDPKFRGMGLGNKMYGEALRQVPGHTLQSDTLVSPLAQRVWKHMEHSPSHTFSQHPDTMALPDGFKMTPPVGKFDPGVYRVQLKLPESQQRTWTR